jgi:predicted transcriptional regulator
MPKQFDRPLTEVELELMQIIWRLGECTIRDVHDAISRDRELAYTSVATMMKILEQKGALSSHKKDRAHLFMPKISKTEYEGVSLRHLSNNLFQGSATSMVSRLLNEGDLSADELRSLRKILDARLRS